MKVNTIKVQVISADAQEPEGELERGMHRYFDTPTEVNLVDLEGWIDYGIKSVVDPDVIAYPIARLDDKVRISVRTDATVLAVVRACYAGDDIQSCLQTAKNDLISKIVEDSL